MEGLRKFKYDSTNPLDAFLEEAGYLSLSKSVHQLPRRMMRRHQLDAIYKSVQFLEKKVSKHH